MATHMQLCKSLHPIKRLRTFICISMRWTLIRVDHPFSTEIHRGNEGISQQSLALTVSEVTPFKTHHSYHPNSTRLWNMQSSLFSLWSCGDITKANLFYHKSPLTGESAFNYTQPLQGLRRDRNLDANPSLISCWNLAENIFCTANRVK